MTSTCCRWSCPSHLVTCTQASRVCTIRPDYRTMGATSPVLYSRYVTSPVLYSRYVTSTVMYFRYVLSPVLYSRYVTSPVLYSRYVASPDLYSRYSTEPVTVLKIGILRLYCTLVIKYNLLRVFTNHLKFPPWMHTSPRYAQLASFLLQVCTHHLSCISGMHTLWV